MAAQRIYFLFNGEDGSYNCHGLKPFPPHMNHDGVTERLLQVDLGLFPDITMTFYDEVGGTLIDASGTLTRMNGSAAGVAMIEKLLTEVAEDPAKKLDATPEEISRRNRLIVLAREYLPPRAVERILTDGTIDAAEAAEIKTAIQAAKGA